ncbi:putative Cell division control protein 48 [Blattamonas nauphoetae]|uniref:Cell division control protein 48 n=1 Tax=Blattamonas nauphoetae TaxID=2049346 RepID=A0ABQ9Y637_9EUKA|nr:putative Cell division control protein 48 [Blattamonas nauphoetae]
MFEEKPNPKSTQKAKSKTKKEPNNLQSPEISEPSVPFFRPQTPLIPNCQINPVSAKELSDYISLALFSRTELKRMNIKLLKGVLLSGPEGIGKTHLVRAAAKHFHLNLIEIDPNEIGLTDADQTDEICLSRLHSLLKPASTSNKTPTPTLLFFRSIDTVHINPVTQKASQTILAFLDGVQRDTAPSSETSLAINTSTICIATTTNAQRLNPAMRRMGRLDKEIAIPPPNVQARRCFLESIIPQTLLHSSLTHSAMAQSTAGYSAADLIKVKDEMTIVALGAEGEDVTDQPLYKLEHFSAATSAVAPSLSAGLGLIAEVPTTTWEDIGGISAVQETLEHSVIQPLLASTFSSFSASASPLAACIPPPKGLLFFGPPGTAKTTTVKAIANQLQCPFFSFSCASVYSSYVGEAEQIVRQGFERARKASPSILFLDELDALVGKRGADYDGNGVKDRILTTLLNEMDGIDTVSGVLVMAATNRLDMLDPALLRPGRFDYKIKIGLPTEPERADILRVYFRKMNICPNDDLMSTAPSISLLAKATDHFSGADIEVLCIEAGLVAMRQNVDNPTVTRECFDIALRMKRKGD